MSKFIIQRNINILSTTDYNNIPCMLVHTEDTASNTSYISVDKYKRLQLIITKKTIINNRFRIQNIKCPAKKSPTLQKSENIFV